ncbi:hypothetical protein LCGC14_2981220, partial [marine sediment metagenome]
MDTWLVLEKELDYYGIRLIGNKKCQFCNERGSFSSQGILKTIKEFIKEIKNQKKLLLSLWEDVSQLLQYKTNKSLICDEKMINLFIFSLKDLSKFLICFDLDQSDFNKQINSALNRDINSFSREQILKLPDYKISIDWVHRNIHRLMYICRELKSKDPKIISCFGGIYVFTNSDLIKDENIDIVVIGPVRGSIE